MRGTSSQFLTGNSCFCYILCWIQCSWYPAATCPLEQARGWGMQQPFVLQLPSLGSSSSDHPQNKRLRYQDFLVKMQPANSLQVPVKQGEGLGSPCLEGGSGVLPGLHLEPVDADHFPKSSQLQLCSLRELWQDHRLLLLLYAIAEAKRWLILTTQFVV